MGTGLGTAIGLGIDFVVVTVLYYWYKRSNRSADEIKNSKILKIDETLEGTVRCAEDSCIPYACIVGEVTPVDSTLRSRHVEGQNGVMQQFRHEKHKSEKVEGLWSDAVKVIQDKVQSVPFTLQRREANGKHTVLVVDPESANYIIDDLTLTHDAIEPDAAGGLVSRILDRLSGYVVSHKTERMLLNNTTLFAIGELRYVDGKIQIAPPRSGSKYILTKKESLQEIIQLATKKAFLIKVLLIGTATVGVALLGKLMYDVYQRRKEEIERRRNYEEMRRLIEAQRGARTALNIDGDNEDRNMCVVCLANTRQIVLLDCGHICLCADCVMQLPIPMSCPVCKQPVVRYIPTNNP